MCFAGTDAPGAAIGEERKPSSESETQPVVYNPNLALSIEQQRQKLPVFKVINKNKIIAVWWP